jgi:hypothetical protein
VSSSKSTADWWWGVGTGDRAARADPVPMPGARGPRREVWSAAVIRGADLFIAFAHLRRFPPSPGKSGFDGYLLLWGVAREFPFSGFGRGRVGPSTLGGNMGM